MGGGAVGVSQESRADISALLIRWHALEMARLLTAAVAAAAGGSLQADWWSWRVKAECLTGFSA